jgi:quinol monooxygenase YgiN
MTAFIATMTVAEDKAEEFERLVAELSELAHRNEPGLIAYDVLRHAERASTYVFYARFKDRDAFEFHQQADFHQRLVPPILDCIEGEMDLQFFDWVA